MEGCHHQSAAGLIIGTIYTGNNIHILHILVIISPMCSYYIASTYDPLLLGAGIVMSPFSSSSGAICQSAGTIKGWLKECGCNYWNHCERTGTCVECRVLQSKYPTAIETTLHNYAIKEAYKPIYVIHCSKTLRGEGLTLIRVFQNAKSQNFKVGVSQNWLLYQTKSLQKELGFF